jgi:hypothetical protein
LIDVEETDDKNGTKTYEFPVVCTVSGAEDDLQWWPPLCDAQATTIERAIGWILNEPTNWLIASS